MRSYVSCGSAPRAPENKDAIDSTNSTTDTILGQIQVTIFLNPTMGTIIVVFNQQISDGQLQICDNIGKLVYWTSVNGQEVPLNLSHFAAGIYYISISVSKQDFNKTVIKN